MRKIRANYAAKPGQFQGKMFNLGGMKLGFDRARFLQQPPP